MTRTPIVVALLCALALVAAPAAVAKPTLKEANDKTILSNDQLVVWFQGHKPVLKLFPAGHGSAEGASLDNESGAIDYRFVSLVEYRDVDGDGAPSDNEIVALLDLDRADAWTTDETQTDGAVVLNLTLEAPVKLAGGGPGGVLGNLTLPEGDAKVTLAFVLRSEAVEVEAANATLEVPTTSIKWDLVVERWPLVDPATSRLALVMVATGEAESTLGVGVDTATLASDGQDVGVLSWTTLASGRNAQGADVPVPVKAALLDEKDEDANESRTRVAFTYDAAGLVSVTHDPTIGIASAAAPIEETGNAIGEAVKDVPAPGVALLVAGVGAVALALRSRRS